jgi:hypothetical protein
LDAPKLLAAPGKGVLDADGMLDEPGAVTVGAVALPLRVALPVPVTIGMRIDRVDGVVTALELETELEAVEEAGLVDGVASTTVL